MKRKEYLFLIGGCFLIHTQFSAGARTNSPSNERVIERSWYDLQVDETAIALMSKSDCNVCHNKDVKTVGPSYVAIAERYSSNAQTIKLLSDKIVKGGSGNWGQIPMTPHPDLSKKDAEIMVSYILSLGKEQSKAIPRRTSQ